MNKIEMFLIATGLSLDVFAYALYKGAMISKIKGKDIIKMSVLFSLWQMFSLIMGTILTTWMGNCDLIQVNGRHLNWISSILFFMAGMIMIIKAANKKQIEEKRDDTFQIKQMIVWSLITSLDSFLAGIGAGFLNAQLLNLVVLLGIMTVVSICSGIWTGHRMGCQIKYKIIACGGIIIFASGVELLFRKGL